MQTLKISELKKELGFLNEAQLTAICLNMAKLKKENKEYLHYLVFDAHKGSGFAEKVKAEIEEEFSLINRSTAYFIKKSLRKTLKLLNKYIRFVNDKQMETEWQLVFLGLMRKEGLLKPNSTQINNIYKRLYAKTEKCIDSLHPDLQFDYRKMLNNEHAPDAH